MRPARSSVTDDSSYPYDPAWRQLREPVFDVGSTVALVAGAALCVGTLVLWLLLAPFRPIRVDYVTLLVGAAMVAVLHELAHAAAFVAASRGSRRIELLWRRWKPRLLFHGVIPRHHYVAVLAAPFVALSLGPVVVSMLLALEAGDLAFISLLNALACGGDLVAILLVLEQAPDGALMRRHGDALVWKPITE